MAKNDIEPNGRSGNAAPVASRSLAQVLRDTFARVRTTFCDECSQPLRWWNRRVWLINGEKCAHPQCWNGRQLLKGYIQLMSEEVQHSLQGPDNPIVSTAADAELRELRMAARSIHETVEGLERRLQQAEESATNANDEPTHSNTKLPVLPERINKKSPNCDN